MTNTNLIRCSRGPLSCLRAAAPDSSDGFSELACESGESGLIAAVGPWAVRLRAGRRPAMEVYEYGELLDVVVESSLGDTGLRGARRGAGGGPGGGPLSCAWGRLPPCGEPPPVRFLTGGLRRRATGAAVRTAGRFWFASAAGEFRWAQLPVADCACAGRAGQEDTG
ncbi:hypothetical protein Kpho02_45810 [Kitasatospora phosalacinea]|uniref:Uncharacterized protein n=1 Tax=Kitasatospora phosalacinea TaxID=2065 RepID=A0A9W6QD02_9ACTN|nr:hypothetical protein [Kitasatospora phosalacinea]GLW72282.1 hypothetical protein Kpho02_45810 [Kitasatospora phosalacinea]